MMVPRCLRISLSKDGDHCFDEQHIISSPLINKKFDSKIISSLPLQMLIWASTIFFPVWYFITIFNFIWKYGRLEEIYRYTSVSVFLCIPSVEMFRLYFSFEGNLRAKMPELGSSFLLSLLIEFPLLLFLLLAPGNKQATSDLVAHVIYLILQTLSMVVCALTIKIIADHQIDSS
ncbi:UNVERIFIED_CONTAM: hypothetical protein RMT77_004514 [Armadillidium vulgare]